MSAIHSLTPSLQDLFLSLLPKIEWQGRFFFGHLKCVHQRQEAIAEMIALAWKWFVRLVERGKDPSDFPTALALFAARAVCSGRRLCGQEKTKDVLSPLAQKLDGFTVDSLPHGSSWNAIVYEEALHDNTQTPVPDQVAFRLDFPAWLKTRTDRDRRIVQDLMRGERTRDVAQKYGTTPGRISQLRRDFHQDWTRFCREVDLGFISYLDFTTLFSQSLADVANHGWRAAEVWLCSENHLGATNPLTEKVLVELKRAVPESNRKADAALGPMN